MNDFKVGEYIIYVNGSRYEIGRIKSLHPDGAFVAYHEGETGAKTPYYLMHKLINGHCIRKTTLGGKCFKDVWVPPKIRGMWIAIEPKEGEDHRLIRCSNCGLTHRVSFEIPPKEWIENRNFCRYCGADMRPADDQGGYDEGISI